MILSLVAVVAASAFGSVVIVTKSALAFASMLDKRDREDRFDREALLIGDDDDDLKLYLFEHIRVNVSRCVKCNFMATSDIGPRAPQACNDDKCEAHIRNIDHFHVACATCNSTWLMRTRDQ